VYLYQLLMHCSCIRPWQSVLRRWMGSGTMLLNVACLGCEMMINQLKVKIQGIIDRRRAVGWPSDNHFLTRFTISKVQRERKRVRRKRAGRQDSYSSKYRSERAMEDIITIHLLALLLSCYSILGHPSPTRRELVSRQTEERRDVSTLGIRLGGHPSFFTDPPSRSFLSQLGTCDPLTSRSP
jgi:hypothetical protein